MDGLSLRDAYELLRRARQQQGLDTDLAPRPAVGFNPDGYGPPQSGLLGRLLALQAEQASYQPDQANVVSPPLAPSDPNFRQLARRPFNPQQSADGASNQADSQSGSSYSPVGYGNPLNSPSTSQQGVGSMPAPPRITTAQLALPGMGIPMPPPVPVPPIPTPAVPDWWKAAWKLLQLYPRRALRNGGGGNDEDEDCYARAAKEEDRCWARNEDYAHRDFLHGCLERAVRRRNLCVSNGGRPDPMEPPEWGLADEEIWRNHHR
jgi:hypothetical protein